MSQKPRELTIKAVLVVDGKSVVRAYDEKMHAFDIATNLTCFAQLAAAGVRVLEAEFSSRGRK